MRDSEVTIEKILQKSAILFNTQGYKATSISDITGLTGLTKGAIYRHFESKQDLEKKVLHHLSSTMDEKMRGVIKAQPTAGKKLRAIFNFFGTYITDPPIKGGCPLLNAAIEADDTNPTLRYGALRILDNLQSSIILILNNGVKHGQLKPGIDKESYATIVIAALEGAIMMSKLRGNNDDIRRVIRHLEKITQDLEL
jgi:TetR/AcrR family transcriptional regulator, transcriptional repressor for nem operon